SIRSRGEGTMSVIVDDALAEANDARQAEETRAPKAGFDEAYGAPARGDPERAFGKACSRCGDDDGQVEKTCVGKQWLCTNCAYEEDERAKARKDRRPQSVPTDTGAGRAASDAYASKDVGASGSPVTANTRSHIRSPARGGPERATSAQWPQCSCAEIQAADVSRHFRECLRRAVYPKPSAPKPQPVEPQGPDRCRKGTPACTVDHTGMLGGYSECVAPKPQPVEQTKVVSVISLSDRPQPEPAKVEPAVCNAAYSGSTCAYEYDHPGDHLFSIMKAEPAKVACTDCGGEGWDMGREGPYVCAPCRGRGKVEPVKVEAPERVTLVKTVDRGWMVRLETGPGTVDYVRLDIHDATQAALYSANELLDDSFMHDKSWKERTADLHAALAQAEAERDRAIGLLYALNECRHAPAIQGLETFLTELDATKPQPVEPAKVVSVISLSDRPQSAEPAKVEAPNPDGICQQCGEFMGT